MIDNYIEDILIDDDVKIAIELDEENTVEDFVFDDNELDIAEEKKAPEAVKDFSKEDESNRILAVYFNDLVDQPLLDANSE